MKSLTVIFSTLITLFSQALSTSVEDGSILLLGDSWASLSGDYAANICGASTTRNADNKAKAGTTANQWAEKESAVDYIAKDDYEYVWLSIGGNDFLDNKCDISLAEDVAADIVTVISHIVDNASNENIKILYFGYSVPSSDVCGNGMTAELFEEQGEIIFDAIQNSDYADYVTLIDISEMFVTWSSSPLSDETYYYDEIHLNQLGYLKLFSSTKVQRFFGCSVAQMAEVKAISGAYAAKDWSMHHIIGAVVGALVAGIVAIALVVSLVKAIKNRKVKNEDLGKNLTKPVLA